MAQIVQYENINRIHPHFTQLKNIFELFLKKKYCNQKVIIFVKQKENNQLKKTNHDKSNYDYKRTNDIFTVF